MSKGRPSGLPFYMGSILVDCPCEWDLWEVLMYTIPIHDHVLRVIVDNKRN